MIVDLPLVAGRCIRTGRELLDAPAFRRELKSRELAQKMQKVLADKDTAADLLLAAALHLNSRGMVLVSTPQDSASLNGRVPR